MCAGVAERAVRASSQTMYPAAAASTVGLKSASFVWRMESVTRKSDRVMALHSMAGLPANTGAAAAMIGAAMQCAAHRAGAMAAMRVGRDT